MKLLKTPERPLDYLALSVILAAYLGLKGGGQAPTQLLLRLVLLTLCYAAAVTDLRRQRVDNRLVAALGIAWVLILAPLVLVDPEGALTMGGTGLAGFLLAGAVLLLVYFVSRKGLGGGDVKLAPVLGAMVGSVGLHAAVFALALSFISAGLAALWKIVVGSAGTKSRVAMGPCMIGSALVGAIAWGVVPDWL